MIGAHSREFFIEVARTSATPSPSPSIAPSSSPSIGVGDCRVYGAAGAPNPMMRNEWGNPIMNARGDAPVADGDLSEWPYYGLGPEQIDSIGVYMSRRPR